MNTITQTMKFRQAIIEYSFKNGVELSMIGDTFLKIKARQPCQGGEVEIFVRKYYLLP